MATRRYERNLIMLKPDTYGYSIENGKISGHAILEIRNGKSKISIFVQNIAPLKKNNVYKAFLVAADGKHSLGINCGVIPVDSKGKGELKYEFDPDNVGGSGKKIEQCNVITVLLRDTVYHSKEIIAPLTGYVSEKRLWKNNFEIFSMDKPSAVPVAAIKPEQSIPKIEVTQTQEMAETATEANVEVETEAVTEVKAEVETEAVESLQNLPDTPIVLSFVEPLPEPEHTIQSFVEPLPEPEHTVQSFVEPLPEPEHTVQSFVEPLPEPEHTVQSFVEPLPELKHTVQSFVEPLPVEPPASESVQQQKATDHSEKYIEQIFTRNPPMRPFPHQKQKSEWVRIGLNELALLPINAWEYAKKPFILAGYKRFSHLILGRIYHEPPQSRALILGVPGVYAQTQEPYQFWCMNEKDPESGDYGYWIIPIQ